MLGQWIVTGDAEERAWCRIQDVIGALLHPGTPSFFPSILPSLPLFHFEPCNAGHLHHHHQIVNIVIITLLLVLTSIAVGGLLPERQGWLGHPRYHHFHHLLLLRPDPQHQPVAGVRDPRLQAARAGRRRPVNESFPQRPAG